MADVLRLGEGPDPIYDLLAREARPIPNKRAPAPAAAAASVPAPVADPRATGNFLERVGYASGLPNIGMMIPGYQAAATAPAAPKAAPAPAKSPAAAEAPPPPKKPSADEAANEAFLRGLMGLPARGLAQILPHVPAPRPATMRDAIAAQALNIAVPVQTQRLQEAKAKGDSKLMNEVLGEMMKTYAMFGGVPSSYGMMPGGFAPGGMIED